MERLEPGNVRPQDARLVVAISSRALFDLDESHRVFEAGGEDAYSRHQVEKEDVPLAPGVAFPLAKKLLALNGAAPRVEVILISRNSADTGLRVFNSIRHHNLDITRAAFTRWRSSNDTSARSAPIFLLSSCQGCRKELQADMADSITTGYGVMHTAVNLIHRDNQWTMKQLADFYY